MTDNQQTPIPNAQELVKKANDVYDSLKEELESSHSGEYVVIEGNSEKHFIGTIKDEAMAEARREFPNIVLFVRRIGELEKASHHVSSFSPKKYAGAF